MENYAGRNRRGIIYGGKEDKKLEKEEKKAKENMKDEEEKWEEEY
jgi:hypothetical protein